MDFARWRRSAVVACCLTGCMSLSAWGQQTNSPSKQPGVRLAPPRPFETRNAQPISPPALRSATDTAALEQVEAIRFNGLQAGASTMSDVQQLWGKATM